MKKISIVIVTYNSELLIDECLHSIQKFSDVPKESLEVLVVDNSQGERAASLKRQITNHPINDFIETKYIHNSENFGYGQGNNIGIKSSSGDIICIMNPDVRFTEPLFKDVLLKFEDSNLALLGYKQTGGFDYSFYMKPELKSAFSGWKMKLLNKGDSFNPKKHYLSGAFFFIDKNKFSQIGMFDEKIFMYFEEPDIAKRIDEKKYTILYEKSKKYIHLVGDRTAWSERAFTSEMNSLKYYLTKYNFDTANIINKYLEEYKFKVLAAKFLNDKNRLIKFQNEIKQIEKVFDIK